MKQNNIQKNKEETLEKLGVHKQNSYTLRAEHNSTRTEQNDEEIK